uniref:Uncharacterized protein n=1 Tax=viral metagenome TaxID=1070528 RepID=A0A6M3M416_9ZZZZ
MIDVKNYPFSGWRAEKKAKAKYLLGIVRFCGWGATIILLVSFMFFRS